MVYDYFQGYFFSKPVIVKSKEVAHLNINLLRILELLYHDEPDFDENRAVVATDLGLSYKLLRLANSVLIGKRHKITSFRSYHLKRPSAQHFRVLEMKLNRLLIM